VVEAPRGLLSYRVSVGSDFTIRQLDVSTPSERNWYVVPPAVANKNILQDFPIIDASFGLSVAGWDR
jgi:Ni,Fe-hydrogenase III large subunit